ncbi:type I phosphomannose isomerase catalytic subunit [Verrucomicrobiota bacterium]
MSQPLYPLLFSPVYKDYIWGGDRIRRKYNRHIKQDACAESWEIADRPEGMSVVLNGPLAGKTLHELVDTMGTQLVGSACKSKTFPLLIKIIDAKQRLSVQAHPDDHTAAIYGGEAKTEMWYVLESEPGSKVFAGLKSGTNRESFETALKEKRLEEVLCEIHTKPEEAIFVPGGRVHAIAEGCLLLEIQQNSNTTYRVYDWGRMGKDGKPRELHINQAFQVINWKDYCPEPVKPKKISGNNGNSYSEIINCPYFNATRIDLSNPENAENNGQSFHILFAVSGKTIIEGGENTVEAAAGTSCLIPAKLKNYTLKPVDGDAELIRIRL